MAILKIVGHCDLSRKTIPDVIATSEDYLWLQFWLVQDSLLEETEGGAAYTLADLQRTITDFGPSHFDPKQSNPWQYFNILLLVGLFENALEYLYQQGQQIDVVHFSVVLLQAGTLRTGKAVDPLFVRQGIQGTFINFGTLISSYATSLGTGDIVDAVNYLLLLSLDKKGEYDAFCHKAVRDLILKSGDYGTLLGDVRHDGSVLPGSLSQYARLMNLPDTKSFMDVITAAAAEKCDREGRFREALQLYNLANKYDRVIEVLCARLCRSFVGPYTALEADELRRTAESILSYYTAHGHISTALSPAARNTCATLIQLISVRKAYEGEHWAECLDSLLKLPLIPLEGDVAMVSSAADRVRDMPDNLTILLPELLIIAMNVIVRRNSELRGYIGIDAGRAQQSELLRRMARNLMTFVGMLRLRVPQEVYAQLTRMEIALD
jgi:nuclear pore complex protein Nup93